VKKQAGEPAVISEKKKNKNKNKKVED